MPQKRQQKCTFSQVIEGLKADGWVQASRTVDPGVAVTSGAIGAICAFLRLYMCKVWPSFAQYQNENKQKSQPLALVENCSLYDSLSDVGESRVWFASKNLTPCRMH